MTADPVTLISTPDDVEAWYRCDACGFRQRLLRGLPHGGASCARCAAQLNASDRFDYAGLRLRLFAHLVDAALISVPALTIVAMFVFVVSAGVQEDDSDTAQMWTVAVGRSVVAAYFVIGSIACVTAGKWGARIRVVDAGTWRRPSILRGMLRTLGIVLTIATFGAGYLMMLFDEERRALHDRIAGTRVIER